MYMWLLEEAAHTAARAAGGLAEDWRRMPHGGGVGERGVRLPRGILPPPHGPRRGAGDGTPPLSPLRQSQFVGLTRLQLDELALVSGPGFLWKSGKFLWKSDPSEESTIPEISLESDPFRETIQTLPPRLTPQDPSEPRDAPEGERIFRFQLQKSSNH